MLSRSRKAKGRVLQNKVREVLLENFKELESTTKLIEKLSILNEYKLNLFKDFYSYTSQKK